MTFLAIAGGLLLTLALVFREYHLAKERSANTAAHEHLRIKLVETQAQLRRTIEDCHVLQRILQEKHLLDETDLAQGRLRIIEGPKRRAEERTAIARRHDVSPTQLVMDEDPRKVH